MEAKTQTIHENFARVHEKIARAARTAGRNPDEVKLVVVSKAQPAEVIQAAIESGAQILGENYPEETVAKMGQIANREAVQWHMIGHLQTRKAGLVVDHFDMLESLDSLHLAERLDRMLAERATPRRLPVLLEFNVGGEDSKQGWDAFDESHWNALVPDVERVMAMQHLSIQGLMTMPPWAEDPETSRPFFQKLYRLREYLSAQLPQTTFEQISMGTSGDYEIAVQEGATLVRVGRALLGERPKKE